MKIIRDDLRRKVKKGVISTESGKLVPDENTKAVVKLIYNEFLKEKCYQTVTDRINQQRINPPSIYNVVQQIKWDS